jgi:hypothetical protein
MGRLASDPARPTFDRERTLRRLIERNESLALTELDANREMRLQSLGRTCYRSTILTAGGALAFRRIRMTNRAELRKRLGREAMPEDGSSGRSSFRPCRKDSANKVLRGFLACGPIGGDGRPFFDCDRLYVTVQKRSAFGAEHYVKTKLESLPGRKLSIEIIDNELIHFRARQDHGRLPLFHGNSPRSKGSISFFKAARARCNRTFSAVWVISNISAASAVS